MLAVLSVALATTIALGEPPSARSRAPIGPERIEAMLTAPERHVRGVGPTVAALLERGARRSYTFARLLDAIERSDVIVYVEAVETLPTTVAGRLMFASSAHGQRYLRIQVAPFGPTEDMISTLGHELQHAIEVADSPEVHDEKALVELYKRIGHYAGGKGHFDTVAAREAGKTVRTEIG